MRGFGFSFLEIRLLQTSRQEVIFDLEILFEELSLLQIFLDSRDFFDIAYSGHASALEISS
jgi:hypothetical protein